LASTVWRGYISFGLISIPVRLFRAARAERVSLRRLHREQPAERNPETAEERPSAPRHFLPNGASLQKRRTEPEQGSSSTNEGVQPTLAPIRQAAISADSDELLPEKSLVKGYEYEKGRFVVVDPEDLKDIAPKTSTNMGIEEFVQLSEIDPVFFETSYYVVPEGAGQKAYALLYSSMRTTGLVAIAQFAMHNRDHVIVLRSGRSGLLAHTMFYASEVRSEEEFRADTTVINEKELSLAETLIHSLAAPFEPEKYRDTYREKLESILAKKVAGQPFLPEVRLPERAEVVDISDALRRSLANLKKPAASASPNEPARTAAVKRKAHPRGKK
jgi:DNA end-binding protein Ku